MAVNYYTMFAGATLEQGDILPKCRIFSIPVHQNLVGGDDIPVEFEDVDVIVMSQSCDLVEGREKVSHIVLCRVPTLSEILENLGHPLQKKENQKALVQYRLNNLHPMAPSALEGLPREFSVVHFGMVHTMPVLAVRSFANQIGNRLRLRSPFREHLSQRFSFFFNRIALDDPLVFPEPPTRK